MADFFAKDRQVAWDQAREEFTKIIDTWEEWCAEQIEFGADPDDSFCHSGCTVGGVQAVVNTVKDIVDRMERS